ncbi:MAG: glycosyltransferase family 2 protein [Synergistaceae bacterium]|nr:glycosyltransferase family 2 protein [Synergistaceae bacterium]
MENREAKNEALYIVVPAYNESENIAKFVEDWYPVVTRHDGGGRSRLVVIDDGSRDDTYAALAECARTRPLLIPLTKANSGHGPTLLHGYRYAISEGADFIFQTDSDGQTNPEEFEPFWDLRGEYDAILGSRPDRQDGPARKFVENVLRLIMRAVFGVRVPDANAPFRLMRRALVEKYVDKMPPDFNLPNVMLTTYFAYFHERIAFREISFKPRQGGVNSINMKKIVKIGWKALGDFRTLKRGIDR